MAGGPERRTTIGGGGGAAFRGKGPGGGGIVFPKSPAFDQALYYSPIAGLSFFLGNPERIECAKLLAKLAVPGKADLSAAAKQVVWLKIPLHGDLFWWQLPKDMNPIPWNQTIREHFDAGGGDNIAKVVTRDDQYTGHIILGELFFLEDMRLGSAATFGLARSDRVGHEFFHFVTEQGDRQLAESLGLGKFEKYSDASKAIQAFIESGCK